MQPDISSPDDFPTVIVSPRLNGSDENLGNYFMFEAYEQELAAIVNQHLPESYIYFNYNSPDSSVVTVKDDRMTEDERHTLEERISKDVCEINDRDDRFDGRLQEHEEPCFQGQEYDLGDER